MQLGFLSKKLKKKCLCTVNYGICESPLDAMSVVDMGDHDPSIPGIPGVS